MSMKTQDLEKLIAQATPLPWPDDGFEMTSQEDSVHAELSFNDYELAQKAVNSILSMSRRCDELAELLKESVNTLTDVAQLLDGWHSDGTVWSEWDESVRQRVSMLQQKLYAEKQRNSISR